MAPTVSVVIPARNEERYLGATLEALRRQTCPPLETLVVVNACTDRTADVAVPFARVLHLDWGCAWAAQNLGAEAARGDVLLFLDADIHLPPRALEVLQRDFGPRQSVATFLSRPTSTRPAFRALCLLRNFLFRTHLYRSTIGAIVCRREAFLAVGGFDPGRTPRSNRDLVRKLLRLGRYRCLRVPVLVSTRRYERWGLFRLSRFWVATFLLSLAGRPPLAPYEDVR